ncbi:GNAT family N-acetyltransferase [Actinomadura sp. HBU206391]|uniref:GNAT family N-acetyltransferase n=1 Tax=Actinomadura sp. HBU206391 TaxID=2731692 RepID=UPI001C9CFF7E|nr:GNAT family N-acetyltransferase [Actinomadura sp. HBU206391]
MSAAGTGSTLLGWNAVSPTATRPVCLGAVEHSVYVHPDAQGQGDAAFLNALIISAEATGIWTIRSGIFPENTARLALHHRAGFRTIGVRVRIGRHHGGWHGVILLERRSKTTQHLVASTRDRSFGQRP